MNAQFYRSLIKLILFLGVVFLIAVPDGLCACQKLGEYCGSPATETFPACCPFDEGPNGKPLKCKEVDNGVGTCQQVKSEEETTNEEEITNEEN